MIAANAHPLVAPIAPPSTASMTDSARNWRRMSARRAPTDFRRPISCVRSRTDISMMFMMTMPPTTTPIATIAGNDREQHLRELLPEVRRARRPSRSRSCRRRPGADRCATRIASSARCIAGGDDRRASAIFTEIVVVCRRPYIDSNVVIGSITKPSNDWPSTFPFAAIVPTIVNRYAVDVDRLADGIDVRRTACR